MNMLAQQTVLREMEGFGELEYADQTVLHPLGLAMVVTCGFVMLLLPRRYALWPMIVMAAFVAPAQRLVILSLDFNLLRVMVLFAWARILLRHETAGFTWKTLDVLLIAWATTQTVAYTLLWGTSGALVNRLGVSFDAVGMYFVFRCLVRSFDDLRDLTLAFIVVSVPVAVALLIENQTGRNAFAFFGGVPELTRIREGRLRCQGAFNHPILAGCFWAAVMPLIAAYYWLAPQRRWLVPVGLAACLSIVYFTASSTPVLAVLAALVGGAAYGLRRSMRLILAGVALMIVALHLVMVAPVWHLLARVSAVGGSTGWHRYKLIDSFIENAHEWWLIGTMQTGHWFWGSQDVTNHYIAQGVSGGLATLVLFLAVLVVAYRGVGRAWRMYTGRPVRVIAAWAVGVSLFVHCNCFIGVTYNGQINLVLYLTLAIIGSMTPAKIAVPRRTSAIGRTPSTSHHPQTAILAMPREVRS